MSIFRLLPFFALLIATSATNLAAQSVHEKNSVAVQSSDSVQWNSSAANRFSLQSSQFGVPHTWLHAKPDSQSDAICLKLRIYKVARDGPNTDSMHPAGYSTCSPAARFTAHSAVLTEPSAKR
jgi:hypothetical protein